MKFKVTWLVLLMIGVVVFGGCGKSEPTPDASETGGMFPLGGEAEGRMMPPMNRLMLGIFALEDTDQAVTPEQAAKLLPLWQMIQGGSLQSTAEMDAVLKQIEGQLTEAQLAAIDALKLTMDDLQTWMQAQGIEIPEPAAGQGLPEGIQNMSEEERAQMREKFQNTSPEERATMMAERGLDREGAPGVGAPGAGVGFRGGRAGSNAMLEPLITLLTERAAQ
jgi:hypothetical protein